MEAFERREQKNNQNKKGAKKMDDQTKRKMIRNYFKKTPEWAIGMIIIGVVIFIIGVTGEVGMPIVIGILAIALGAYGIYSSRGQNRRTDRWMNGLRKISKALTRRPSTKWEPTNQSWLANQSRSQALAFGALEVPRFTIKEGTITSFGLPLLG